MLGETAESPPQERRHSPCSHAIVAVEVTLNGTPRSGCGKLISKEGEGVSVCCLLKSAEGIPPQMPPSCKSLRRREAARVGCEGAFLA